MLPVRQVSIVVSIHNIYNRILAIYGARVPVGCIPEASADTRMMAHALLSATEVYVSDKKKVLQRYSFTFISIRRRLESDQV
jgi:hypothetical protein